MKKLLIVVDYQKDFVDGSLGFPGAELLDKPIAVHIEASRAEGAKIAFTFDTHGEDYLSTKEGKDLPVPHCITGSEGHELYGETAKVFCETDLVFYKNTFGSSALMEYLMENPFDEIELVGLVSNICVLSNAVLCKAALPEAKISVIPNMTGSFDEGLHESAMDILRGLYIEVK